LGGQKPLKVHNWPFGANRNPWEAISRQKVAWGGEAFGCPKDAFS